MAAAPPPRKPEETGGGAFDEQGGFFDIDLPSASEIPLIGGFFGGGGKPTPEERKADYNTFAKTQGLPQSDALSERSGIEEALRQGGVDVDNPVVQTLIESYGDMLTGDLGPAIVASLREQYPAVPAQAYDSALAQSGFSGAFTPPTAGIAGRLMGQEGLSIADFRKNAGQTYEENPDTGWIRFQNGVLVSPDGQVAFDPTSHAPGSEAWKRDVVANWGPEKVDEWRKRLHEYGYLSKDEAKVNGVDAVFLQAISAYHIARYANGGKPVAGDLAGTGASSAGSKPPIVDFEDFKAQTRNDVREQYRRVFGEDPTDGEVAAWSEWIINKGMELQKKFRRKDYGGAAGMAATEAEERFVERLEQSPEAQFLTDSTEENTRLRDALQQAVVVTNSLAG